MTNGHFFVVSKFSLSLNVGRQRGCLCVLCRLDPDSRIFSTCNLLPEGYKFHLGGISSHVQYKTKQRLLEQIELFYNLKREKKKNRSSAVFLLRPFAFSSDIAQCILASVSETTAAAVTANPNKRSNKEVLFVWELCYVHALIDRQESLLSSLSLSLRISSFNPFVNPSFFNPSTAARHITIFVMFTSLMSGYKHLKTSLS